MNELRTWLREFFGTNDMKEARKIFDEQRKEFSPDNKLTGYVKMSFPYYAPDPSLPPLPTPEDLEEIRASDNSRNNKGYNFQGNMFRVNDVYAVKYKRAGMPVLFQEAENLYFLQQHNIRAPKLYAAFEHGGADPAGLTYDSRRKLIPRTALPKFHYLIMEWVDGIQFEEEEWDKLSLEIQHKLCYKIGLQLQKLRSIQPPQPRYYGRINNQCFDHFRYPIAGYRRHERAGPFYTYDSYLERLFTYSKWSSVLCIMVTEPDAENVPAGARFVSSMWLEQFSHEEQVCEPKLTHGDVKLRNMVFVKPPKDDQGKIEDLDVILIDWESLAWEPAWYEIEELTTAFAAFSDSDIDASWMSYLGFAKAIKPFPYTEALAGRAMLANMNVH